MTSIPGYTRLGRIRITGSTILFRAVREADGLRGILKMPLAPSSASREHERYRAESGLLQRLRDVPGVPRVLACELGSQLPVLFLEDVEGEPLEELLGKPLGVTPFLELALSLVSLLAEIHRHGVIHRDIKPSNIIVTPAGKACLIDFGSATFQHSGRVEALPAELIEGTLAYMSPEQTGRMNRAVDSRTDLYSLGVTFYELLTGTLPFHGRDPLEWFHAHLSQVPKPPRELVPDLPPVLSAIVMKLLAKVTEERYQRAEGLAADLARCREGLRQGLLENFPLGLQDAPIQFQLPQRLYGRDTHVAALLRGLERVVRGGKPELLLVRGPSGIGKSSVVHELHKPVVQRRGFFLSGRFDPFQRDIPYAALTQAIQGLVQQLLAVTDDELARWRERLLEAWDGNGQVLAELIPQLELIAGKQPALPELSPSEAQYRFHRAFQQFLGVFASTEHPLVVFLDDLQWADPASLRLLQHLLTRPGMPPLLWIGAYQDNEVGPLHPLNSMLEEVRRSETRVTELRLEPLSPEQIQRLAADTLPGMGEEVLGPLVALVHEKTGGNPFFLLQLMVALNQEGLLARKPEGRWRWDAEGVRKKGYAENVFDFLVARFRQLPPRPRHVLGLAACVGNTFSLPMLGTLSGMDDVTEVEQALELALEKGLLGRHGLEQYRFLHDRIQQAAHALIPEEQRGAVHLRIGRLLLASLSPEESRERLFEVLSQLNAGWDLIEEPAERLRVARLNAEAGWKAQASMAHPSAISYFKRAFELIPGDPWETEPALAFRLRHDQALCERMSGNAEAALHTVEELQRRVRTHPEIAEACCLKSELHLSAGETRQAVDGLLEGLARMGMPMPPHPTWEEVEAAHAEVWTLLGERSIESLAGLPLMTAPDMKAVMRVLATLLTPASITDSHLFILLLCRVVSLSVRHGITADAAFGHGWFGVVLGSCFKRYQDGQAFGTLARTFVEQHEFTSLRGKVLLSVAIIEPWTRPLSGALELSRAAFHHAVQVGDIPTACDACGHIITHRLGLGHRLEEIDREAVTHLDFIRKAGVDGAADSLRTVLRYVQQLRGLSRETVEAWPPPEGPRLEQYRSWSIRMQAHFMSGAYEQAREAGTRAAELRGPVFGVLPLLDFHLYRALTLAACFERAGAEEQRESLADMEQHRQQLAEWARSCPGNFLAAERMVSAELARVTGRSEEAIRAYEEAIRSAQEHGFLQYVALANELAANFWATRQAPTIFGAFARAALLAYQQWGARGKVQSLEERWPSVGAAPAPLETITSARDSARLEALTVVKAQQAISSEIVLERLAATLLEVAIENAGAQRGALLLPRGTTLAVVAISGAASGGTTVISEDGAPHELPWDIFTYVERTHEQVLITDASKPHPFSSEVYLERSGARSVLCLPLLRQEKFHGVLYLENTRATNAFAPFRRALLEHLAAQAAISIENARLYGEVHHAEVALRRAKDELEQREEERTRELKQAQSRLVDTAREMGMAEVAANVLHNVGNVLTSAFINLETMRATMGSSRVGRVKQTGALLQEHRERLQDFLTNDARGRLLPDYMPALGEELLLEQAHLREGVEAMGQYLEHIRAIVQVQQIYARKSLLAEECDLTQLVEDALRIQMAAIQRHGISVKRELAILPKVRVDKHKVLQILISLISNAKHALNAVPREQRSLCVRSTSEGKWVRLQVIDNGSGITPEVHKKLFVQGFSTRRGGQGFGLHTSAQAAQMLGGRLSLESEGPGKGATATLEFPLG